MKKKNIALIVVAAAGAALVAAGILASRKWFLPAPPPAAGELSILAYGPQGSEVEISTDGITVMFDRPVVPLTTLDAGRDRALPIAITPSVEGKFFWLGTRGFIFRPEEPFAPATAYRVELPAGVASVEGYRLPAPLVWQFSTVAPRVLSVTPGGGALLPKRASLLVRFNLRMEESDVESKLKLAKADSGEPLDFPRDFRWEDDGHALRVQFRGKLPWSQRVVLELPAGLKARAGEIGSAAPVTAAYEVPDKNLSILRVVAHDPKSFDDDGPRQISLFPGKEAELSAESNICYFFSQPVTKDSFRKAFRVQPSAGEEGAKGAEPFIYFSEFESFEVVDEEGKLASIEGWRGGCAAFLEEHGRPYAFSVDPEKIASLSGAVLEGAEAIYRVRTSDAPPSLGSLVTKNILSAKALSPLPYRATNLDAVTVRLYRMDRSRYDEEIQDERILDLDPKADPPLSRPLGRGQLKLPMDRSRMTIDQARMPADFSREIPVAGKKNRSLRFTVDLAEVMGAPLPGIYLVEAIGLPGGEPEMEGKRPAVYTMIQITAVALAIKRDVERVLVWATDIESGEPLAGLPVKVLLQSWDDEAEKMKFAPAREAATDAQGVAVVPVAPGEGARACAEVALPAAASFSCEEDHDLTSWRFTLKPGRHHFAYVYTDRPIYRPGQRVFFSSFVRAVREGRYFLPDARAALSARAVDAAGKEIFTMDPAKLEAGGVVSGSFELEDADDLPRGTYTLTVQAGEQAFSRSFVVSSYRKPSFKVEVAPRAHEIVSGEELAAEVAGAYFFGAPMRKASAHWSIMTATHSFAPEGYEGFSFLDDDLLSRKDGGEDGEFAYESDFEFDTVAASWASSSAEDDNQSDDPRGPMPGRFGGRFLEDPKGGNLSFLPRELDDAGKLAIAYKPDLKKYPTSQMLTVEASVEDPAHQEVSAFADVVVHKGEFYLGLKPERWTYGEGERASVAVVSLDTRGKPAAGKSFAVEVLRREHKYIERRNAQGSWEFVHEAKDTKLASIKGKSDASGRAALPFELPQGGEYRFVARARDGRGNDIQAATTLFAWGKGYVPWRLDRLERIELVPDKDAYRVGETARVLVKSLLPATRALVTLERGRVLEERVVELGGNASHLEIPIEEGALPNLFVSVVAHAGRAEGRPPLLFSGATELRVEPESKRLSVAISTDRLGQGGNPPIYRPGEEVVVRVKARDAEGRPVKAHVILSVADESVLKLLNYELPDLVKKFYYLRPNSVVTSSSLVSLKAGDAGMAESRKRRIFRDTAHFVANLATDDKGEGSFAFRLPDDTTTWVIEAVAASEPGLLAAFEAEREKRAESRPAGQAAVGSDLALSDRHFVGSARAKVMATLPLVLRTALPRFAAWEDELQGKVIATNRGAEALQGTLAIGVSGGARLEGGSQRQEIPLVVPAGGEVAVPVGLRVDSSSGSFVLSAEAKGPAGEPLDGIEVSVPVRDRFAPEVVAASGMTKGEARETLELPEGIVREKGGLEISLRASLALAAAPSLKALLFFPWGCSEQKSATLVAYLLAREMTEKLGEPYFDAMAPFSAEELKGVEGLGAKKDLLDRRIGELAAELLEKFQSHNGGMRYWPDVGRSSNYLASVQALWALTLARDAGFPVDEASRSKLRHFVREKLVDGAWGARSWDEKAYGLWALSFEGVREIGMGEGYADHVNEMSPPGQAYLLMAMKRLEMAGGEKIAAKLGALAKEEPRHTSWPASPFFWSSAVKTTALAAAALLANDPADPRPARALPFLLNRKRTNPAASTQENLAVAWFIREYARATGEGEADFEAEVEAGGEDLLEERFDKNNLLQEKALQVPMAKLAGMARPVEIEVEKEGEGVLYYDLLFRYYLPPGEQPTREEGLILSREFYALGDVKEGRPLTEFAAGQNYKGHITIVAPQEMNYIVVQELLPAGFEAIDMALATSSRAAAAAARAAGEEGQPSSERWEGRAASYDDVVVPEDYGMDWGFGHQEVRDDAIVWSDEFVPAGVYHLRYPVRAATPGRYLMPGAVAFEFYEPEIFGRSRAREIVIREGGDGGK